MTKETISETAALKALLSETADHQILAGMLGFVADRLMALDVDQLCGAGVHERSAGRVNHRNGYRPRRWETRAGTVDVQIPKLRKGTYFPEFLEPRRASEKAMTAVIQEAYIQGVSTRSVDDLVKTMGMTGVSKSQVSRLCVEIDERVDAFLDRPGESHEGYVRRICSKNRLFHPAFLRMTLSDFLSFALLSRFIAMCLMTAKFLGP